MTVRRQPENYRSTTVHDSMQNYNLNQNRAITSSKTGLRTSPIYQNDQKNTDKHTESFKLQLQDLPVLSNVNWEQVKNDKVYKMYMTQLAMNCIAQQGPNHEWAKKVFQGMNTILIQEVMDEQSHKSNQSNQSNQDDPPEYHQASQAQHQEQDDSSLESIPDLASHPRQVSRNDPDPDPSDSSSSSSSNHSDSDSEFNRKSRRRKQYKTKKSSSQETRNAKNKIKLFNKLCKSANHHKLPLLRVEGDATRRRIKVTHWLNVVKNILNTHYKTTHILRNMPTLPSSLEEVTNQALGLFLRANISTYVQNMLTNIPEEE